MAELMEERRAWNRKSTTQEIIAAYQATGSVWESAKRLGMAGQSVHERLRAVGYPLARRNWTNLEREELRQLVGHMTLGEIARRLGRPYAGIATQISRLGLAGRSHRRVQRIPRGAGYDKTSVLKYSRQLEASGEKITRFARRNGLGVELLVRALERYLPDWWIEYRKTHSDLEERTCIYCGTSFIPANGKQILCSRSCGAHRRADERYFGGKRRTAIGLSEGVCQLCERSNVKALSAHHIFGKENDPENDALIALCSGCHKIVTLLATRTFVNNAEAWENLIGLAWARKHGSDENGMHGIMVHVDMEDVDEDYADYLNALHDA